jgi:hypothetical protein
MTSILSFKRSLLKALNNIDTLASMVTGFFSNIPHGASFPYIAITHLKSEDWSYDLQYGRILSLNFEVVSDDSSSKTCMDLIDILELHLPDLKEISPDFIISKIKVLGTKIDFDRKERIWIGILEVKFWIETIH